MCPVEWKTSARLTSRGVARTRPSPGEMSSKEWSVEVTARGDDLVVSADLPGVKPEDVRVEAEGNSLIIRGETRAESPPGVRLDNARAEFKDGVLEITLPGAVKALRPQRRSIQIQGAQPSSQQSQQSQQSQPQPQPQQVQMAQGSESTH